VVADLVNTESLMLCLARLSCWRHHEGLSAAIARTLHRRDVLTKLRQSAGQEVEAGCGQLRARAVAQPVMWVR
jgi:hypothetical protein